MDGIALGSSSCEHFRRFIFRTCLWPHTALDQWALVYHIGTLFCSDFGLRFQTGALKRIHSPTGFVEFQRSVVL